ncbi:FAD binding domain protein [Paecilomyces variotii No. 5]|uniref:FAD binding domain protein n=1 Tax=Byssochlamys spectabilis (strain No. 5 / NBRC 109023) TaxID=1356009 RepID=V5G4K2_BYSSN|nr:FAD binding domain protein [Paecilomyces variotii No. 5]
MRVPIDSALGQELEAKLDSTTDLVTPESPKYEASLSRWSDGAVKRAGAVAYPTTVDDVSTLVKFAAQHNLDLAVKGGGHSTGGTSSTTGGLVIDLSRMRRVTVDTQKKLITAQGGALWQDVDDAAIEHGLATVGGTVNHTGIGGLTLGGGLGWLCGMYGMVIDNLVAAKVVVPDGRILTVSDTENSDLFWAIRGAGQNFGVTVEFKYRAYEQTTPVYFGFLTFAPDKVISVVEALNRTFENADPRGGAMCVFAQPPGAPGPVVNAVLFYNGNEESGKEYFSELFDLEPLNISASEMPYNKVNGQLNPLAQPGGRKALKVVTLASPVRPEYAASIFEMLVNQLKEEPDMASTFISIEFYDLAKTTSIPPDATSCANRGTYQPGIIGLSWTDPAKDNKFRAWGRKLQAQCIEWIKQSDKLPNHGQALQYANYAEPDDVLTNPFGVNKQKLAVLKAKYDPQGMFDKATARIPVAN